MQISTSLSQFVRTDTHMRIMVCKSVPPSIPDQMPYMNIMQVQRSLLRRPGHYTYFFSMNNRVYLRGDDIHILKNQVCLLYIYLDTEVEVKP